LCHQAWQRRYRRNAKELNDQATIKEDGQELSWRTGRLIFYRATKIGWPWVVAWGPMWFLTVAQWMWVEEVKRLADGGVDVAIEARGHATHL
jgi:hypothetical protein